MNIYLDVQSPAVQEAGKLASDYGLQNHGFTNLRRVYWNLPTPALYEESVFRSEARLTHYGPIAVSTGKHTARAAADKFVVREQTTEDRVWWGQYNRPFTGENFSAYMKDSHKLANFLLDKVRVVTVPGSEFGFEGHLRLSYCGAIREIREGLERIQWALDPTSANELYLGDRKLVRDWL